MEERKVNNLKFIIISPPFFLNRKRYFYLKKKKILNTVFNGIMGKKIHNSSDFPDLFSGINFS